MISSEQQAPVIQSLPKYKIIIPNLPISHYQFWLKNHPKALQEFEQICSVVESKLPSLTDIKEFRKLHTNLTFEDPLYLFSVEHGKRILSTICSKIRDISKSCWGYETNCQIIHLMPECYGSHLGEAKNEDDQKITWFNQADFGYILNRRRELESYCRPEKVPNESIKSSLECTKNFRTCRGENLYIKFDNFSSVSNQNSGFVKPAHVGGWNCDLQRKRIPEQSAQKGLLESWYRELENYDRLSNEACDVTIEKQAFIIKLDSPMNMYHFFCNFLNLYATFHLNNRFSDDNQIIIWDRVTPRSKFDLMWSAFSSHRPKSIGEFEGKRVCFKKFIFTLLPRMVEGLYYNTPLIPGCTKTGLFDAFNKHVLHKLNVRQHYNFEKHQRVENIRVTIVSRSTTFRKILNENDLVSALKNRSSHYHVQLIDFMNQDFLSQLNITQNTDILVGLHGAGLTHTLFLPDWAALFELHDCKDTAYHELARLRGVSYEKFKDETSFKKEPVDDEEEQEQLRKNRLDKDDKFFNYNFNANEFVSTIEKLAEGVKKRRSKHFNGTDENFLDRKISDTVTSKPDTTQKPSERHEEL